MLRTFRDTSHPFCPLAYHAHIRHSRTRILRDHIGPPQTVYKIAHRQQQLSGFVATRVADDHRLAASDLEVRQRGLVGHAARQAQYISQGIGFPCIGPHPAPAHSGSKMGVVYGDKTVQTATRIRAMDHLLVAIKVRVVTEVVLHCHLQIHIHIPSEFSMYPVKIMTIRHAALWWTTSTVLGITVQFTLVTVIALPVALLDFRLLRDRSHVMSPAAS